MKIVSIRCPECNAVTQVSTDKKYCYCPYCGTMSLVDDGTKRVEINKNIKIDKNIHSKNENYDYARIKEAEEDARKSISDNRTVIAILIVTGLMILCLMVPLTISVASESQDRKALLSSAAEANVPLVSSLHSSSDYKDENYLLVKEDLENRGFTNVVTSVEKSRTNHGEVVTVTVDGENLERDEKYPADIEVVIRYKGENLFER